ncbi:MAG: cyclase [Oscillatoriophycideae cyanobacterium NC_groundwater_1537_Pr4_S-0.65um_50_18]|nr:cyclase [Oscillatoriophycideae cyanobacterium NC_groundwater_1537_Pr4_S-0.65um_50_18]
MTGVISFPLSDAAVSDAAIASRPEVGCGVSEQGKLLQGEILLETRSHTSWGGAVTAQMYIPLRRSEVWQQLTDYPRWVQFFPDLVQSEVIDRIEGREGRKRLYQVARKAFFLLTAQVEIYLKVLETVQATWQQIQFQMERGNFHDFAANLHLQDFGSGTLLTYTVQATPTLPIPSQLIQQAMRLDLPANMQKMRQVLCGR